MVALWAPVVATLPSEARQQRAQARQGLPRPAALPFTSAGPGHHPARSSASAAAQRPSCRALVPRSCCLKSNHRTANLLTSLPARSTTTPRRWAAAPACPSRRTTPSRTRPTCPSRLSAGWTCCSASRTGPPRHAARGPGRKIHTRFLCITLVHCAAVNAKEGGRGLRFVVSPGHYCGCGLPIAPAAPAPLPACLLRAAAESSVGLPGGLLPAQPLILLTAQQRTLPPESVSFPRAKTHNLTTPLQRHNTTTRAGRHIRQRPRRRALRTRGRVLPHNCPGGDNDADGGLQAEGTRAGGRVVIFFLRRLRLRFLSLRGCVLRLRCCVCVRAQRLQQRSVAFVLACCGCGALSSSTKRLESAAPDGITRTLPPYHPTPLRPLPSPTHPQVRVEVGWGGKVPGVSVFRGPLLFALPLTEDYRRGKDGYSRRISADESALLRAWRSSLFPPSPAFPSFASLGVMWRKEPLARKDCCALRHSADGACPDVHPRAHPTTHPPIHVHPHNTG